MTNAHSQVAHLTFLPDIMNFENVVPRARDVKKLVLLSTSALIYLTYTVDMISSTNSSVLGSFLLTVHDLDDV